MEKKIFKPSGNKPINPRLDNLEQVEQRVAEIIKEKDDVIKEIRDGFVECVVVFIDLVDSTKFKIENSGEPEKWILRVKQFGDIIKEYIPHWQVFPPKIINSKEIIVGSLVSISPGGL